MKGILLRLLSVFIMVGAGALLSTACVEGPANQPPVISSLTSDKATVYPADDMSVTCVATDPDGDNLSYTWSFTGGSLQGTGHIVTGQAPDAAGSYTINVEVTDGKGGTARESYTITVMSAGDNRPPVVESLRVDLRSVEPGKKATVTCQASDPDGDTLTYSWWTELGRIEGTGNVVKYVGAPYVGEYIVEVHVRDGRGGNAVESVTISVAENERPEISRVSADPDVILTDYSTTITCTAQDPDKDPLTYTWYALGGTLSGSGKTVTWTAPGRAGYFTIEVTVDDGRGGSHTGSVEIQVQGLKLLRGIDPVARESGAVKSDGTILSLWTVGDDSRNNAIRTYLSFDISKIKEVEEFRSAKLTISTLDRNGTPWSDLGDLLIDEVEYGSRALKDADYALSGTRLERFASAPVTEIDLTSIIGRALSNEESRFQIRVYFQTETDNDNLPDNMRVTEAELSIYFVEKTE